MKVKSLFLLSGILLCLLSYIFFFEKNTPSTLTSYCSASKLFNGNIQQIDMLEIHNQNGKFILKRSNNSQWFIVEPITMRADISTVSDILQKIALTKYERHTTPTSSDLKILGLERPNSELIFTVSGQRKQVKVGADTVLGKNVYIDVIEQGCSKIYIVSKNFAIVLQKSLKDFRAKTVFDTFTFFADTLRIERDNLHIELKFKENGWKLILPIKRLADSAQITKIQQTFQHLVITDFFDHPANNILEESGLKAPRMRISLKNDTITKMLLIGNDYDHHRKVFVKNENNFFGIEKKQIRIFFSSLYELSAKQLISFKPFMWDSAVIKFTDISFKLETTATGWHFTTPVKIGLDMKRLASFFHSFRIRKYLDAQSPIIKNLPKVFLTISLYPKDNDSNPITYIFYPYKKDKEVIAYNSKSSSYVILSNKCAEITSKRILSCIVTDISKLDYQKIKNILFKTSQQNYSFSLRDQVLYLGNKRMLDNTRVRIITALQALQRLNVYALNTVENRRKIGLNIPNETLVLSVEMDTNVTKTFTIDIGTNQNGYVFLLYREGNVIFRISEEDASSIRSELEVR